MSTWTLPPGMAVEPLHGREDGPADVALVTLAPGAVTPWEAHADAVERIRILSGCLCVEVAIGERVEPVDLAETSGRLTYTIAAGERHRLVNPFRTAPAVFVLVMAHRQEEA